MTAKRKGPAGLQPDRAGKAPRRAAPKTTDALSRPAEILNFPDFAAKPKVYLAGKIDGPAWRREIAPPPSPAKNRTEAIYAEEHEALDPRFTLDCGAFVLTGPFALDDGHSSSFPTDHGGVAATRFRLRIEEDEARRRIHALSMRRIQMADLVFCQLNELDAFGTLIEIGVAHALGKPLFLHFGEALTDDDLNELWFAAHSATAVTWARETSLREAFDAALRAWRGSAHVMAQNLSK
jgi:nucleoside 2-deoxyribosyltransferase